MFTSHEHNSESCIGYGILNTLKDCEIFQLKQFFLAVSSLNPIYVHLGQSKHENPIMNRAVDIWLA